MRGCSFGNFFCRFTYIYKSLMKLLLLRYFRRHRCRRTTKLEKEIIFICSLVSYTYVNFVDMCVYMNKLSESRKCKNLSLIYFFTYICTYIFICSCAVGEGKLFEITLQYIIKQSYTHSRDTIRIIT